MTSGNNPTIHAVGTKTCIYTHAVGQVLKITRTLYDVTNDLNCQYLKCQT